jgi:DnaJ like chaperone protein
MGWKGMAIGGCLGSLFGGPLGAVLGAALGHQVEKQVKGENVRRTRVGAQTRAYRQLDAQKRAMIFCASAAAMLAKMAKADGHISRDEIDSVEQAFMRLGFTSLARDYAVNVFRKAKDDAHTIYQYADEFAAAVDSVELRELFYELLWDLACADGDVSASERLILQRMPRALRIRSDWYAFFAQQRLGASSDASGRRAAPPRDELQEAYAVLGARASDSADELKKKYRTLAKKNHPDALRAQGLPDELVGKATERMGRINAAWAALRAARGDL